MGGMLGYGYAGSHDDLAGLIAIGAPSDIGRGFLGLRAAAAVRARTDGPAAGRGGARRERRGSHPPQRRGESSAACASSRARRICSPRPTASTSPSNSNHVPVDAFLRALARAATESNLKRYELNRAVHRIRS